MVNFVIHKKIKYLFVYIDKYRQNNYTMYQKKETNIHFYMYLNS